MVRSMFSGVAGLRAHQTKMDVIGNNIANVNTYGFKSARVTFRDALYQTLKNSTDATTSMGGTNARQIGYGPRIASIDTVYGVGAYAQTDSGLDCMISGEGFFIVGRDVGEIEPDDFLIDPADTSKFYLTRVGDFIFDGSGNLVNSNGELVYGFLSDDGEEVDIEGGIVPLRIDMSEHEQGVMAYTLNSDGTVWAADRESQEWFMVGRLGLAFVQNPGALEQANNSYLKVKSNAGDIRLFAPAETALDAELMVGGLEMAAVDLAKEFSDMITTQRGFQACGKIITTTDEMLAELVSLKR